MWTIKTPKLIEYIWPHFSQMPKATEQYSRRNLPEVHRNILKPAKSLPGYEQCWCHGYKIGCGLIRTPRSHQNHKNKEIRVNISNEHKIRCDICKWPTVQLHEIHREPLADSLRGLVDGFNATKYRNIPKEPQDKGVPVHNADLGVGKGQQHDTMMGLQCDNALSFNFSTNQSTSPAPESGPSNVPYLHQVFDMGPDSEIKESEGGDDELEGSVGVGDSSPMRAW